MNHFTRLSIILYFFISSYSYAQESICYGTTQNGRLKYGVKLPEKGINFISYGTYPELENRTYVHSMVKHIVIEAYNKLSSNRPHSLYKYAESGFKSGGKFPPHKTHQNGLSVDFMVPVIDTKMKAVYFPTNKTNRYGYDIEFDKNGIYKGLKIDFEALAAHIVVLDKAAKQNNIKLWRVLFSPDLQDDLYKTSYGPYIKKNIYIPNKKSWVRHDEHYHVDFSIACKNI